jgi:hypothetical protein
MESLGSIIAKTIITLLIFYVVISWHIFQWRNPKANRMTFFTHFTEIVMLEKLEIFQ